MAIPPATILVQVLLPPAVYTKAALGSTCSTVQHLRVSSCFGLGGPCSGRLPFNASTASKVLAMDQRADAPDSLRRLGTELPPAPVARDSDAMHDPRPSRPVSVMSITTDVGLETVPTGSLLSAARTLRRSAVGGPTMTERLPCPPAPGPLRQVRGWLDPWTFLWRCWRAWSNAPPPPELCALLHAVGQGRPLDLYLRY
jgi:hypothetical protein